MTTITQPVVCSICDRVKPYTSEWFCDGDKMICPLCFDRLDPRVRQERSAADSVGTSDWLGARVTREIYMDDGTWQGEGDKCLPRSPLRHGDVIAIGQQRGTLTVRWDDGVIRNYFPHGVDREAPNVRT